MAQHVGHLFATISIIVDLFDLIVCWHFEMFNFENYAHSRYFKISKSQKVQSQIRISDN